MPNLGAPELLIIGVVLVLLFGATRLPQTAKGLAQSLRVFRQELRDDDSSEQIPAGALPQGQTAHPQAAQPQAAQPQAAQPQTGQVSNAQPQPETQSVPQTQPASSEGHTPS